MSKESVSIDSNASLLANPTKWQLEASSVVYQTMPFIGNQYQKCPVKRANNTFVTVNPATELQLASFVDGGDVVIDSAVSSARKSFKHWKNTSPDNRKQILLDIANQIEQKVGSLALLDSLEMGMPISMALGQVSDAAHFLRYNAELIDKVYGEIASSDQMGSLALSQREARGVVGIISPWNFPLLTAMLAIAPALAVGNTVVIKPSEQTPSSVLKMAEIAAECGLPAGVMNVVPGLGMTAGAALAKHPDVDKLHFTGSTQVGRQLMVYAGQSNGKPVMLELGGKSPQIVFEDAADLSGLGGCLAKAAFFNSGQRCVARTRLLVHENIKEQVIESLYKETRDIFCIGSPLDEKTSYGPIASSKQFQRVKQYREWGETQGGELQHIPIEGQCPDRGYFMLPVIVDGISNHDRIAQEEIFGPLLSIISFKRESEALALANDINYGLAATVWTKDLGRARRFARDLQAGEIAVCTTTTPATTSFALSGEPFGASGHGVLGGRRGLDPYTRFKSLQFITD